MFQKKADFRQEFFIGAPVLLFLSRYLFREAICILNSLMGPLAQYAFNCIFVRKGL